MKQALENPIASYLRFYPNTSEQKKRSLERHAQKFREENPDWRTWTLRKAWADKNGILQTGTVYDIPEEFPHDREIQVAERMIRQNIRLSLECGEERQEIERSLRHFKNISRERIQQILTQEMEIETPIITPIAYRLHFPGQEKQYVDYIIAELPNPQEGQEYGDFIW